MHNAAFKRQISRSTKARQRMEMRMVERQAQIERKRERRGEVTLETSDRKIEDSIRGAKRERPARTKDKRSAGGNKKQLRMFLLKLGVKTIKYPIIK